MALYTVFLADASTKEIVWKLKSNDLELIVGMLAAGLGIVESINANNNVSYYVDSTTDVSSFRKAVNIPDEDVRSYMCGVLTSDEYGIWMKSGRRFHYNLYAFKTNSFFQGVISMCHAFQVDFRDYIYGFPFDNNGNQYALKDYVMAPYQVGQDAPDLDDVDEEAMDNENLIEPFARTDDIITIKD